MSPATFVSLCNVGLSREEEKVLNVNKNVRKTSWTCLSREQEKILNVNKHVRITTVPIISMINYQL